MKALEPLNVWTALHRLIKRCQITWLVRTCFWIRMRVFFFITINSCYFHTSWLFFSSFSILCRSDCANIQIFWHNNSHKWGGWKRKLWELSCPKRQQFCDSWWDCWLQAELCLPTKLHSHARHVVHRDGAVAFLDGVVSLLACVTCCARWWDWQRRSTGLGGLPLVGRRQGQKLVLSSCLQTLYINACEQRWWHRRPCTSVEATAGHQGWSIFIVCSSWSVWMSCFSRLLPSPSATGEMWASIRQTQFNQRRMSASLGLRRIKKQWSLVFLQLSCDFCSLW